MKLFDDNNAIWAASADACPTSQQRRPIAPAGDGFQKRVALTRANSTRVRKKSHAQNAAPEDDPFGVPKKGGFSLPGTSKESRVPEFGGMHSNVDPNKTEADEFGTDSDMQSRFSFLDGVESVHS
jgi:hypothetical protein